MLRAPEGRCDLLASKSFISMLSMPRSLSSERRSRSARTLFKSSPSRSSSAILKRFCWERANSSSRMTASSSRVMGRYRKSGEKAWLRRYWYMIVKIKMMIIMMPCPLQGTPLPSGLRTRKKRPIRQSSMT